MVRPHHCKCCCAAIGTLADGAAHADGQGGKQRGGNVRFRAFALDARMTEMVSLVDGRHWWFPDRPLLTAKVKKQARSPVAATSTTRVTADCIQNATGSLLA